MKAENIGRNAGIVWRALDEHEKEMDFDTLAQKTQLSVTDLAAAIGWLSREGKIMVKEVGDSYNFSVYCEYYY